MKPLLPAGGTAIGIAGAGSDDDAVLTIAGEATRGAELLGLELPRLELLGLLTGLTLGVVPETADTTPEPTTGAIAGTRTVVT
ncbi:MAG: hypothetical protein HC857_06740 [Synechococcales cyanobacterium RU_4_20]|nr:hypothetical protein [Synechococcales cyanobacterium RU_4_20]